MNIMIVGATSAIAKAFAQLYAEQGGHSFALLARNAQALEDLSKDLIVRGAECVKIYHADFAEKQCLSVVENVLNDLASLDLVLMAHGVLGDQATLQKDIDALEQLFYVNSISSMTMLSLIANHLEQQGYGRIAYISSVAGDRGRPSNYVYGASKAVLSTFLQGLTARLAKKRIQVLNIKPGFVDTPMTASIAHKGFLWAEPQTIAQGIDKALRKNKTVVYLPWFWQFIMLIVRNIPDRIFNKLSL